MGSDSDSPKVENVSDSEVNQVLARQLQANPEKVKSIINSIDIEGIFPHYFMTESFAFFMKWTDSINLTKSFINSRYQSVYRKANQSYKHNKCF